MKFTWIDRKQLVPLFWVFALILGSATPGAAQQEQQDLRPLHIELGPLGMLRMPSWVALSEGIYKKNGLDVDQCHTPDTIEELKDLGIEPPTQYTCPSKQPGSPGVSSTRQNNSAPDFLTGGLASREPIAMLGAGGTYIAQMLNPQALKRVIILSTSNVTCWPIYARKGITSPEQLRGKRIGYGGFTNIHGFMLLVFAQAMGWDPRFDLNLVEFPGIRGAQAIKALESGELDAIMASDSAQLLAIRAGYKPVVDFKDWKVPMASGSANADVEWLRRNRDTALRFVKSQVEARAVMERDRGAFNRALVKYFNMTDPKMQDHLYSFLDTLPRKPYPAADGLKRTMQVYDSFYPQLRQHAVSEFVDDSFVHELDESGYIDSLYK